MVCVMMARDDLCVVWLFIPVIVKNPSLSNLPMSPEWRKLKICINKYINHIL